uniref:Uncharacterized protein n=1 Tax=Anguilla anguilla TaxID=7936 RepID=A0A0E9WPP1_ANGAN
MRSFPRSKPSTRFKMAVVGRCKLTVLLTKRFMLTVLLLPNR